jgi:multidrug efflux pump subunit AcrA (membrane-fusion protein)
VPSVNSNSRAFAAEARFNNPNAELRPGMFSNAKLMLQSSERAVFVPSNAVFYDSTTSANHIYSVVNGKAHLNVVLKGSAEGDHVRVISGLNGDEIIVLNNQASLYDGSPIETH